MKKRLGWVISALLSVAALAAMPSPGAATERPLFVSVGKVTSAPIGWIAFCAEHKQECAPTPAAPRDVVLSVRTWRDLDRVNRWVNESIQPLTDMDHWGVVEKWSYPDDGYGDCEDYVLLKRRLLITAGPRSALLITVVRDEKDEGHAVPVKTDKGELIFDNQAEGILPWNQTGYRFVKRQSQSDPNAWVALGDTRPAIATAASR